MALQAVMGIGSLEAQDASSSTRGEIPMAGERPMEYYLALREVERKSMSPPQTNVQAMTESPTAQSGAQEAALRAADDPVAQAAVRRPLEEPQVRIRVTERWDGVVTEVNADARFFTARLVPLGSDEPELFADIALDRLGTQDLPLVREGGLFHAITGYIPVAPGQRMQASSIRFRRLAPWRNEDVQFMRAMARKRRAALGPFSAPLGGRA